MGSVVRGLVLVVVLAGCVTPSATIEEGTETVSTTEAPAAPSSTTPPAASTAPAGGEPTEAAHDAVVAWAVADLSARLEVDSGEVEVVSVEAASRTLAEAGCPDEDGRERVIALEVGGVVYHYHAGAGETAPSRCDPVKLPLPPPPGDGPIFVEPKPADEFVPPPGYEE